MWKLLKWVINDNSCLISIINITNACINLEHWSSHFKQSTSIIILKLNNSLYDSPKSFQPIVLLNTLSKLIEKVIGERIQFHSIYNNFIYSYQFRGLKQRFTSNVNILLIYIIWLEWSKNIQTSTLAFGITQFFPLLNHWLIPLILDKVGFNLKISNFFSNYLVGKKTQYI